MMKEDGLITKSRWKKIQKYCWRFNVFDSYKARYVGAKLGLGSDLVKLIFDQESDLVSRHSKYRDFKDINFLMCTLQ